VDLLEGWRAVGSGAAVKTRCGESAGGEAALSGHDRWRMRDSDGLD
jgi:hypothetical protein